MIEKLNAQDEKLLHVFCDPIKLAQLLFPADIVQLDSLQNFDINAKFKLRPYQIPFMSFEYCLADDPKKDARENFRLHKKVGDGYNFSGRGVGKTLIHLLIDLLLDTAYHSREWLTLVTSFDVPHVNKIMDPYVSVMKHHPFFKMFNVEYKKQEGTVCSGRNGAHKVIGVGMALSGQAPGSLFESHHPQKLIGDEMQYETEDVIKRRSQAESAYGCINRFGGITAFARMSPMGRIFASLENRPCKINLPQQVSVDWDATKKAKAIEDYCGEDSAGYKIHVNAEVIEDAESAYDMEKIRRCYEKAQQQKRNIKHFEITKKSYHRFKELIAVSRPKGCSRVWIAEDYGEKIAEIIIWFEYSASEPIFKYEYNITLLDLSAPEEHETVLAHLIKELKPNFIGCDATEAGGSEVIRRLQKRYPESATSFFPIGLNTAIVTGLKRDEKTGDVIYDKNHQPIEEKAFARVWANHCIKKLWYSGSVHSLFDLRLDKQFAAMREKRGLTGRISYFSIQSEDHLHAANEIMALMWYLNEFNFNSDIGDEIDECDEEWA